MQPFRVEIREQNEHVVAVLEVDEVSSETYLGKIVQDDMSNELRAVLDEYHEACESPSLLYVDAVQTKLLAFGLKVVGIPGQSESVSLRDFQLGPDGLFLLMVD